MTNTPTCTHQDTCPLVASLTEDANNFSSSLQFVHIAPWAMPYHGLPLATAAELHIASLTLQRDALLVLYNDLKSQLTPS